MVLSDEERKANRRKYDAKPDVKKRSKEYLENPKNKISSIRDVPRLCFRLKNIIINMNKL